MGIHRKKLLGCAADNYLGKVAKKWCTISIKKGGLSIKGQPADAACAWLGSFLGQLRDLKNDRNNFPLTAAAIDTPKDKSYIQKLYQEMVTI